MSSRGGRSRVMAKALASRPSDLSIAKQRPIVKPSLVLRCGTSRSLCVNCRSLAVAGPLALAVLTPTSPRPDGMLQIPNDPLTPSSDWWAPNRARSWPDCTPSAAPATGHRNCSVYLATRLASEAPPPKHLAGSFTATQPNSSASCKFYLRGSQTDIVKNSLP